MSFLDTLRQDALAVFHATANALHAQLANTLSQAGHPVTEADHVDTLVQTASNAATGAASAAQASTTAPNYADAALATFTQAMTAAAVQFAQAHLPAKFQGVAADVAQVASSVISGATSLDDVKQAAETVAVPAATAIMNDGVAALSSLADSKLPGAGALVGAAASVAESFLSGTSPAADAAPKANTSGV